MSNIDMFKRVMEGIRDDLTKGFSFKKMDPHLTKKLIKVVLQKLSDSVAALKGKDENFASKNTIVNDLFRDYGWSDRESPISLGELWRLNRSSNCLLYTSPSPRDQRGSRMPSSA